MAVSLSPDKMKQRLLNFEFRQLFNELMWNRPSEQPFTVTLPKQNGLTCTLRLVAEKSGFKVYQCVFPTKQDIPADPVLKQIEREVAKQAAENIIIFSDAQKERQVWQWVRHEKGKTAQPRLSRLDKGQSGELLNQKVSRLLFGLDDDPTITGVSERAKQAFDTERVTKNFYDRFQKELGVFKTFISGITEQGDQKWYASLMLNRLMFIYFIQKKGFLGKKKGLRGTPDENSLEGDHDYLRNRLEEVQAEQGQDEFHTFYRYFLLKLFSDLNTQLDKRERSQEMDRLLGRIPYLNGGLFDVHQLEQENPDIRIPDDAFTRVFDFFDDFDWYLDDRPLQSQKEINPDVLGYIFEKYINQKQMGAYYTKEDITGYISKNTIIPFLFNEAEKHDSIAFRPDGPVWSLLVDDPDKYIYDAVKHGVDLPLPPEIAAGVHDVSKRSEWNRPAPVGEEDYALPTEIWREVVARRTRYAEVREKIANGEITSINDLITYNLDIEQFARDVLTLCEGPDLLCAFYDSIERVTVLDPTCGSGAFLFAALNILHPLYEACLVKMQEQVDERDRLDANIPESRRRQYNNIEHFRKILARMNAHANRDYFILKSIILNNLYGVDIMAEATEICKLRLFLKLVAQVQRYKDIEPLPDIDFNIRAGNTLVGFASYAEASESIARQELGRGSKKGEVALQNKMDFSNTADILKERAKDVERAFQNFRAAQIDYKLEHTDLAGDKRKLRRSLKELEDELNIYLAKEYGYEKGREEWRKKYQPFHWFVEFYEIIESNGGFDVIIGNPPYVEYSKVRKEYTVKGYRTESCGNLYAMILERSRQLQANDGHFGMIIPSSAFSTERMKALVSVVSSLRCWFSFYDFRPAKLFDGVNLRLSILLIQATSDLPSYWSTTYNRWYTEERKNLFEGRLHYQSFNLRQGMALKIGETMEQHIYEIIERSSLSIDALEKGRAEKLFFHDAILYWIRATDFSPSHNGYLSTHVKTLNFGDRANCYLACSLLNSSVFYWWWTKISNCRDLNVDDVKSFRFASSMLKDLPTISYWHKELMKDFLAHSQLRTRIQKQTGEVNYREFNPSLSKPIIDEIDRVLAQHYGFTDEELDFIINYDIKYRMGRDNGENGESGESSEETE